MHIAAIFAELSASAPAAWAWFAAQWQSFASNTGSALISSIWQGAVIVCALEIGTRLIPRISAAHRFAAWAAGFAIAFIIPFLAPIHFGGSPSEGIAAGATSSVAPQAIFQLDARWGFAIAALWLLASAVRAFALAIHSIRLRRLWKAAQPVEINHSLLSALDNLRSGRVSICTTQMLDRPSVIGFLSPRILVPGWLLSRLTPGELEQIVLHEAEHLRRRDDWTNLIQKLCLVVFPLNPALAWIEHHLCREREMACDEGVIRITNAPRAYAACLASLAERGLERRAEALSLGAWHRRSELVHRVHSILLRKRTMGRTAAGALLAALGSMLFAGSVEMATFPQLVAFVPQHNTQAMTPARQKQLDALLARENAESRLTLPHAYSVLPTKAVLPSPQKATAAHTTKHVVPKLRPNPDANVDSISTQQVARADQLGDRVLSSAPHAQQWVVVTTWEEVSAVSRVPQTVSDFEPENAPPTKVAAVQQNLASKTAAVDTTAASSKNQTKSQSSQNQPASSAHHFAVTQLILRVLPANPNTSSTQPPAPTVREGWFVIQL